MKKILITGKNSYIGGEFKRWLENSSESYEIKLISLKHNSWKEMKFSEYDVVLHVAGIAHVSSNSKMEETYYKINRDLAIETAEKAKKEGVKQFIFMSSMIVYGKDGKIGENKIINLDTRPYPTDHYGKSKLSADIAIQNLSDDNFKTVVIRTPMVYGPNCKGNFPRLISIARNSPFFPDIYNQRSMIFIDNLNEFIKSSIDMNKAGLYFPQNDQYASTKEIIDIISRKINKNTTFVKWGNPLIKLMSKNFSIVNKIFGNKIYSKETLPEFDYCVVGFEDSIKISIADR